MDQPIRIFQRIDELQKVLDSYRRDGISIGLVPTMGSLHDGHSSLLRASIKENDKTVCSIFVNKIQFNNEDDYLGYPQNVDDDSKLLSDLGCDILFAPSEDEMYGGFNSIQFQFGEFFKTMEGAFRPGHFNGVGVVVSKLFNIVRPDRAYFGEKDLQQLLLINRLVKELNFQIDIKSVPTIREDSGLALSSRNKKLSDVQAGVASGIYLLLNKAVNQLLNGDDLQTVRAEVTQRFKDNRDMKLEYVEFVDIANMATPDMSWFEKPEAICIAAEIGGIRLIDNLQFSL